MLAYRFDTLSKPVNPILAGKSLAAHSCAERLFGGERGIRTPGGVTLNGFQDRRIRPLCHLSMSGLRGWHKRLQRYTLFSLLPNFFRPKPPHHAATPTVSAHYPRRKIRRRRFSRRIRPAALEPSPRSLGRAREPSNSRSSRSSRESRKQRAGGVFLWISWKSWKSWKSCRAKATASAGLGGITQKGPVGGQFFC